MPKSQKHYKYKGIPVQLIEEQFNEFVLPHLSVGRRGPKTSVPPFKIFNYIMKVLYTGMQWSQLTIDKDKIGRAEIHYTWVFKIFKRWSNDGSLKKVFENSVFALSEAGMLDLSVLHGDGSTTMAKKGGDGLGYSGHKHMKGEKVVCISDRHGNVLSPYTIAPANRHESPLFDHALKSLKSVFKKINVSLKGIMMSLDSAYDSRKNRKLIFNSQMIPNIKRNKRNRKAKKRGPKRFFDPDIWIERLHIIERTFAWEDKFKRLLLRFERISANHFGMKLLAYAMINLRNFC